MQKKNSKQIFISHATADKDIADAVCDLLSTGFGINAAENIFCSSLEGLGVPPGENFVETIKKTLKETKLTILILSQNYFVSPFCMAEFGAVWIMGTEFFPLIVPPLEHKDLNNILYNIQVPYITDKSAWIDLVDKVKKIFFSKDNENRRQRKTDKFLTELNELLLKQNEPAIVSLDKFKQTEKMLEEANKEIIEFEQEIEKKNQLIDKISSLKDADAVNNVKIKHLSEFEQFNILCKNLKNAAKPFSYIVEKALYYAMKKEPLPVSLCSPFSGDIDSIKAGIDSKFLTAEDERELEMISLNTEHPKIRSLWDSAQELENFMSKHWETMTEIIEDKYKVTFDITDKEFWSEVIGINV